jgi:16S rRNA (guanine966-N2)-methyltransferase
VRVVAGRFGGRRLAAPRGRATRPTADRVREALFSMLGDVSQARVLDLYAGSGALGIEALSRGARSALFVESDPRAAAVIRRNLTELGAEGEVRRQDVVRFLRAAAAKRTTPGAAFDLVFCDPPYDLAPSPAAALAEHLPAMTSDDARIVTESDKRRPLELPLPLLRERIYGDTRIAIHGG